MTSQDGPRVALPAHAGLGSLVALGLGTAVGVSIFSVLGPGARLAGSSLPLAILIAAIPVAIVAVTYGFMGATFPVTGASYEWNRRFLNPRAAFALAWLRIASNIASIKLLAITLVRYLGLALGLSPGTGTAVAVIIFIFVVNTVSAHGALRIQSILMVLTGAMFAALSAYSLPLININFLSMDAHSPWTAFTAAPVLVSLFFGIEAIVDMSGEARNPSRNVPLAITLCVALAVLFYTVVAVCALGVLGPSRLSRSVAPIAEVAARVIGSGWGPRIVALIAVLAIGKSTNAIFMIFVRSLYAMARAGALPTSLAHTNKRGVADNASIGTLVLCLFGVLLPDDLVVLFLAINVPTLLKYLATCLSALRALKAVDERDQVKRHSRRTARFWAVLGVASVALLIVIGLGTDWRPYVALTIWAGIGNLYYNRRKHSLNEHRTF